MKTKNLKQSLVILLIVSSSRTTQYGNTLATKVNSESEKTYQVLEDWKFRKEKEEIKIYTRWILTSQRIRTRQVKAVMILPGSMDSVARRITDERMAREWMVFLDDLRYYQDPAKEEWYSYGMIMLLGRMASFDVVTHNHVMTEQEKKVTIISMDDYPGYLPEKDGVHRIRNLNTSWILTHVSGQSTRLEYLFYTEMQPVVPVWITDPIVTNALCSALARLRDSFQPSGSS